jgi:hypothetical protein
LQRALIEANPTYLKAHLENLRRYRGEVNTWLARGDSVVPRSIRMFAA